jgi:hypothetical protein
VKTRLYVDGFNLYYGCLKGSAHRWLDLSKLAKTYFPKDEVDGIRYFTARVKPWPGKKSRGSENRQDAYLRAIGALPGLTVHHGHYVIRKKRVSLVKGGKKLAWVSEEKGSDVNLASWMLLDAARGAFERAVVISNDSDLAEPVKMVHRDFGLKVAILAPLEGPKKTRYMSKELASATKLVKRIRQAALAKCHLPDPATDAKGHPVTKPKSW